MGLVHWQTTTERVRAILLALVLVLQGLVPAAALAHDSASGSGGVEICTALGLKLVHDGRAGKHHGFAGLACEQCVMASLAMVSAEPPPLAVVADAVVFHYRPAPERPSQRPRAPPRPPSRAPPISV